MRPDSSPCDDPGHIAERQERSVPSQASPASADASSPLRRRRRRAGLAVALTATLTVVGMAVSSSTVDSRLRVVARAEHVVAEPVARHAESADRADRAQRPVPQAKPEWVHPLPGARTTSCFGPRWGTLHAGIDLAMPENTPVHAAGAGVVYAAGWLYTGYGNSVVIDHGNNVLTHYAHLNRVAVRKGQSVQPGDVIGYEGSTGDSTGPHLHFEVHVGGLWKQIDPQPWMKARGVDLNC